MHVFTLGKTPAAFFPRLPRVFFRARVCTPCMPRHMYSAQGESRLREGRLPTKLFLVLWVHVCCSCDLSHKETSSLTLVSVSQLILALKFIWTRTRIFCCCSSWTGFFNTQTYFLLQTGSNEISASIAFFVVVMLVWSCKTFFSVLMRFMMRPQSRSCDVVHTSCKGKFLVWKVRKLKGRCHVLQRKTIRCSQEKEPTE